MNTLVALCPVGAEKILGNEIKHLGYKLAGNAPGRVFFEGDNDAMFKANLCLRTADRVFLQMAKYHAEDFDQLFDGVYNIPWQDYFKKDSKITIDKVRCYRSKLNSEHAIQSIVQKAVYQKLTERFHMSSMPETGNESTIRVYMDQDEALILLDLSGLPLHKRGYRVDGGIAPLRETVASVLLQEMMWRRKTPLHDPFCGSGTIAIEAALYAYNVAPGFGRRFALENLPFYNQARAQEIRRIEAEKIRTDVEVRITGSDISNEAVERAKKNAEYACVMAGRALQSIGSDAKVIRPDFIQADFVELSAPYENGLILCNPPYGERIGDEEQAAELYKGMDELWNSFKDWDFGIITSHKGFQENFGHYANRLKDIKAGNLDTTLYMYTNGSKTVVRDSNNNNDKASRAGRTNYSKKSNYSERRNNNSSKGKVRY